MLRVWIGIMAGLLLFGPTARSSGEMLLLSMSPTPRTTAAPVDSAVTLLFDRPVDRATVTPASLRVFGRLSGALPGVVHFSGGDAQVTFAPERPFSAGEQVYVVVAATVRGADNSLFAGFRAQFWLATRATPRTFTYQRTLDVKAFVGERPRAYGGLATDLNGDGRLDLTIVNEDTADLRVWLGGDAGPDGAFMTPTHPVGQQASANEAADFNLDGHTDIVVANIADGTLSVMMGVGNGAFAPQATLPVGPQPRGVAVLDADGDGYPDIVNTNSGGGLGLTLHLNDGAGQFGPPTHFDSGWSNEWALAAADMDEDGRLDLVIGARVAADPRLVVMRNNGDATFTTLSDQSAGGAVWMLNTGDLNGDGHEDVATVNSFSDNAAIVFGDGGGQLTAPTLYTTDPFVLATDIGDVDGDGDLDWMTSSYSGDWALWVNAGNGTFSPGTTFRPTLAASCALLFDMDNDGDLDLALVDELFDTVQIFENSHFGTYAPVIMR